MWKLLLTVIFRRLVRDRVFVAISVASLAVGISSFTVLSLYLKSELQYDDYHQQNENIYRVISRYSNFNSALTAEGLGGFLARDYPQLGEYVRFRRSNGRFI